jgi:peroxiredoxin
MARTASTMLALGTPAPAFALRDTVGGRLVGPADAAGKPLLVAFICNHCPYVKHLRAVLASLTAEYLAKGVAVIGVSSNDAEAYPADGPAAMAAEAASAGYRFPYCFDADQAVAKAYRAACTPDFFLFDRQHRLAYRGQFDASRPKDAEPVPVTGADLRAALDAVLAGRAPAAEQRPSIGCNIKWKPGHEPDYAR